MKYHESSINGRCSIVTLDNQRVNTSVNKEVKWNDLGFEYQKTRLFPTLIPSLVFQCFSRGFPASISGQIAGKIWKNH